MANDIWQMRFSVLGIDPNLHPLQYLNVFFRQIERRIFVAVLSRVRPEADFQPQSEFHLVAGVSQTLDCFCYLGGILDRFVDCRTYFPDNLFCFVINVQSRVPFRSLEPSAQLLCYATRAAFEGQIIKSY
jgi:hypothetical protein